MIAFCKFYCKNVPKYIEKLCPNPLKFIKNPSQINENGAQEHSKNDLGKNPIPGLANGAGAGVFLSFLGLLGRFLATFWRPAGRQGAPKIDHFGVKVDQKSQKWCPRSGLRKS